MWVQDEGIARMWVQHEGIARMWVQHEGIQNNILQTMKNAYQAEFFHRFTFSFLT